mgnify:CR=1 FL=1
MTCKYQTTTELGNSCMQQLQCICKLQKNCCHTFTSHRCTLENNMSKTALREC